MSRGDGSRERALAALLVAALAPGCATREETVAVAAGAEEGREVPLWDDLGSFHRPVTTTSAAAQRYFDQGLVLAYGFNHDAALAAFQEAARLDPDCAMAWWGVAYVSGPHINLPVQDPERARTALAALERASNAAGASRVERAIVAAQGRRFSPDPAADRGALDRAYAAAMAEVWRQFPGDPDVGALHAESLMNVHPWDLWTPDGQPKNDVERIVAVLDAVLAIAPAHPLANHLHIHAVEASPDPGRARESADRLRTLVPGSSHLVHMPSHIDIRTGEYARASTANERAIEADRVHGPQVPEAGFYRLYMAHNHHMLAFASMMEGRSAAALQAARAMVAGVPPAALEGELGPILDGLLPVVLHVLVRFGRWDEVLAEPPFAPGLRSANAIRHYARGVALAALGRLDEAERELEALRTAVEGIDERPIGNNPARAVLQVPLHTLEGELLFRRGQPEAALARLRRAVELEDALLYDEPPDWMQPARHPLAATLLAAGRADEAEPILRQDLRRFPDNGWSLVGLARALRARGADDEAAEVERRFRRAWARADVAITSPCACQPGE